MDNTFLVDDFKDVDNFFALVRYVDIDVVVNVDVMMTLLLRHDRHKNVLLMMHGHMDVDVVIEHELTVCLELWRRMVKRMSFLLHGFEHDLTVCLLLWRRILK